MAGTAAAQQQQGQRPSGASLPPVPPVPTLPVPAAAAAAVKAGGLGTEAATVVTAATLHMLAQALAKQRMVNRRWLAAAAGSSPGMATLRQLETERQREMTFARVSAGRITAAMPKALAAGTPEGRQALVRQLLDTERRYATMQATESMRRLQGAVNLDRVMAESPLGAMWLLGPAKDHTEGCLVMQLRFWPWAVLHRVHPPRHHGCTGYLIGLNEAVGSGLMSVGDVPSLYDAINDASGVMMEGVADRLLEEAEIRGQLEARGIAVSRIPWLGEGYVAEAFDVGELRDFRGRWRDGGVVHRVAEALKAGREAEIEPERVPELVEHLNDGSMSALHKLSVAGHPTLFRENARNLPRAEMPQIPKDSLPGFMDFLRSRGIGGVVEPRRPSELRATQNQINGGAVAAIAKGWDPQRGGIVMVSNEGDVLDGHHRWAAAALSELMHPEQRMNTLRFSASTDRILALMREYNASAGIKARRFGEGGVPGQAA